MRSYSSTASFTRPNDVTAYTAGDLVANDTTATNVVPLTWTIPNGFYLTAVKIVDGSAGAVPAYFVHFFSTSPVLVNGDNGALVTTTDPSYLGFVYVDTATGKLSISSKIMGMTVTDGLNPLLIADPNAVISGLNNQVYGLLQASAAYTPSALANIAVTLIGTD